MESENNLLDQLRWIVQSIYDKKGMNILTLDLRGHSSLTDFIVIAEGYVDKHVIALARAVEKSLQERGYKPSSIEGLQTGDWVVLDYFHIMVHLFMPGLRDKYHLESLWPEAKIVDVGIELVPKEAT